jgi:hypothetical protein
MTEETGKEENLAELQRLVAMGEKAYDDMYEVHSQREIDACYRDAKDWYYEAIGLANRLGLAAEAEALSKRLDHIKAVFRHSSPALEPSHPALIASAVRPEQDKD